MAGFVVRAALGALAGVLIVPSALAQTSAETGASSVRVQLGGSGAASAIASASEAGVRVWRGAPAPEPLVLAGDNIAGLGCGCVQIVNVRITRRPARRLRTQGFYSGPGRPSRVFTQGFYSGQNPYANGAAR